jgi:hypothetical protein
VKAPDYDQKIKDLTLIKKSFKNKSYEYPEQELMCNLLYSVRNYLRLKKCTKDLRDMSVHQIISLAKNK